MKPLFKLNKILNCFRTTVRLSKLRVTYHAIHFTASSALTPLWSRTR